MARITFVLAALAAFFAFASALSAPTFCKCTCFTNSTIIPLGPQPKPAQPQSQPAPQLDMDKRASSASCTQCNRAFCLEYNLPICRGAEEKDVVTMCFQRDSRKDQIIVWCFIVGTTSLLGWAAVKHVLEMRAQKSGTPGLGAGGGGGGEGGQQRGGSRGVAAAAGGGPANTFREAFSRAASSVSGSGADGNGSGRNARPVLSPPATQNRGQYSPL